MRRGRLFLLFSETTQQSSEQLELPASNLRFARRLVRGVTRIELHQQLVDVIEIAGQLREAIVPWLQLGILLGHLVQSSLQLDEAPDPELVPVIVR